MKRTRTLVRNFYLFRTFQEWVRAVFHIRDDLAGAKRSLRWFAYVSVTFLAPFWPVFATFNAIKSVKFERARQARLAEHEHEVEDFLDRVFGHEEEAFLDRVFGHEEEASYETEESAEAGGGIFGTVFDGVQTEY